jgi:O-antigen/teichoic acid export membrane protein
MILKKTIINSFIWTISEKLGVQLIQFILSVFIARILSPEDYGTVAIISIFIAISNVFVDSGFGKSLIQENNINNKDYSTVFYFNLGVSLIFYIIIYFSAPFISSYYSLPILTELIRIISLVIIINAFTIIPNVIFSVSLNFKPLAISKTFSSLFGGGVGLISAYLGLGVWSLVIMSITSNATLAFFQFYQVKWVPKFQFSFKSLKRLYNFGSKLFFGALLDSVVRNLSSVFIGKVFDAQSLGFYSKGVGFANIASNTTVSILFSVLFPTFSKLKDNKEKFLETLKYSVKYTTLIIVPFFLLTALLAKPLIIILLSDKWILTASILQIIILSRMISILGLINVQALQAIGRSDITFKQDLTKSIISILFLLFTYRFGIIWIAIGELLASLVNYTINVYPSKKLFNYGIFKQLKEIYIIYLCAVVSIIVSYFFLENFKMNNYLKIVSGFSITITVYITLLILIREAEVVKIFNKLKTI